MGIVDLKIWATENNVEARTLDGFWKAFDNYIKDCPDEIAKYFGVFDKSKLDIHIQSVSYVFDWNNNLYDYIVSLVPIVYKGKKIGRYELKFKTTGETFDDCLVSEIIAE